MKAVVSRSTLRNDLINDSSKQLLQMLPIRGLTRKPFVRFCRSENRILVTKENKLDMSYNPVNKNGEITNGRENSHKYILGLL